MKILTIFIIFLLSPAGLSYASEDAGYFSVSNADYYKGYAYDTGRMLSSPPRWHKEDWLKASLIVGTTAGLYVLDENIKDFAQENRGNTTDKIASFAKPFGEGDVTLPPLAVLYLYGHFFKNEKARRVPLLTLESYVITGVFTQAMKFALHRHRPNTGDPYDTFDGPGFSGDNLAFPSGHSSSAWSVLTVLALEYDDYPVVPPLCYGVAALTALSRVNDNAHWASDAFFGSALGYLTARAVVGYHDKGNGEKILLAPFTGGNYAGLAVGYRF